MQRFIFRRRLLPALLLAATMMAAFAALARRQSHQHPCPILFSSNCTCLTDLPGSM